MIVFLLNLRAKFIRPTLSAPQNANFSAEILQILGLNLARKFDTDPPNPHKFNADIVIQGASSNQTFVAQAFWGFFDRPAHLLVKFDFARR